MEAFALHGLPAWTMSFREDDGFLGADRLPFAPSVDKDIGKHEAADFTSAVITDTHRTISLRHITEQPNLHACETSVAIRRSRVFHQPLDILPLVDDVAGVDRVHKVIRQDSLKSRRIFCIDPLIF